MKLVMMGTGPFAVPTFRALLDSTHDVSCLVTRPDKAAPGRRVRAANPMRDVAEAAGLPVLSPQSVNSPAALESLQQQEADLLVVCDYGQILSAPALATATLGGVNLHGSLLPKYRGAAPINWALLHGETTTGVTVIHMSPQLDAGPLLVQRAVDVGAEEDALQLEQRLAELGVGAVVEALDVLARWDGAAPLGQPQMMRQATKAPRLSKSDGEIDWRLPAKRIFDHVRALKPWPGSFTHWIPADKPPLRLILDKVVALGEQRLDLSPGCGQTSLEDKILVQCGEGVLMVERLQPAGKRMMDCREFLRGHRQPLWVFGSPPTGDRG